MNQGLINFLELLKTDVINNLQANGKYASGKTAEQITIVEDPGRLQLQLPGYLEILETGRGPTSANAVPGNPPMIQRIQEWCQAKGIPDKAAWAIKKSIDKKGYKGVPGIISEPLGDDNIHQRLNPVLDDMANSIRDMLAGLVSG